MYNAEVTTIALDWAKNVVGAGDWTVKEMRGRGKQTNHDDCGVFVCAWQHGALNGKIEMPCPASSYRQQMANDFSMLLSQQ